jgi:hypothetical protein
MSWLSPKGEPQIRPFRQGQEGRAQNVRPARKGLGINHDDDCERRRRGPHTRQSCRACPELAEGDG